MKARKFKELSASSGEDIELPDSIELTTRTIMAADAIIQTVTHYVDEIN